VFRGDIEDHRGLDLIGVEVAAGQGAGGADPRGGLAEPGVGEDIHHGALEGVEATGGRLEGGSVADMAVDHRQDRRPLPLEAEPQVDQETA